MEEEIDDNMVLDYVLFHLSPAQNSYEAVVCSKGKTEKLAIGHLDQLALHLREASGESDRSFKLQLTQNIEGSSWFTKSTITRFLHIVNTPEVVKAANAIEKEMAQLEETKRFHLTLYSKGHPHHSGGGTTDILNEAGLTQKIKVETAVSDVTKNELIRAMDLRLTALGEKLGASFNQATGGTCSTKQISDLAAFAQHFGEEDMRNCLLKNLALMPRDQLRLSDDHSTFSPDPRNSTENKTEEINQPIQEIDTVKPKTIGVSPAKIAEAERQSSTESEESSESNDEGPSSAERSRSLMRSGSARRSASPMRRVQIGRSGPRKATALTIRSLSYFPARERTFNRDTDGTNSGDEESDKPPKKPENTVRSMSVQDAISLFERKQKDQKVDAQTKNSSVEVSITNKKSVLRRWSSGMSDSLTHCENETNAGVQNSSKDLPLELEENKAIEVQAGSDSLAVGPNRVEDIEVIAPSEIKMITPSLTDGSTKMIPKPEETNEQTTASAEWNRQKEAELNQMLMKMMESKPGKHRGSNAAKGQHLDISSEQRGGFYSQYKEKRDEKLRAENTRLRAAKEARFKVMQDNLEQSKAEMASKAEGTPGKQDLSSHSQRPRRNSAPPMLPKKETPKPTSSRKASPRSPLPGIRSSTGTLPRTTVTPPAKPSPRAIPSTSAPSRRKPQPTPSPTKANPRLETPLQQQKGTTRIRTDAKPSMKSQVEKPQKLVSKTITSVKNKSPSASSVDSGIKSAKPSLYSKVTKKSSVVPVESKPFLRKGTGIGPGIGPVLAKTKVSQSDESSKNSGNLIQSDDTDSAAVTAELATAPVENVFEAKDDADESLEAPPLVVNDLNQQTTENLDKSIDTVESNFNNSVHSPVAEIQPDEEMSISSAAWVEVDHPEISASCSNGLPETTTSPGLAPVASSSPHIRHSLSQMLLADNSEPDIIEWGNAEIPPALVYQKDAPKGFKRLLKFGRKNKGDPNTAGCSSPSVFSEGEEDLEESRAASKRISDNLLRRSALQATAYGQTKNAPSESFDADSKRNWGVHDSLTAQSSMNHVPDKSREGYVSTTATSTKATRSFFSLSTFRSVKSTEAKHR